MALQIALTSNGGKDVDAFAGFYMEQMAEVISEGGGFGLADTIYTQLQRINAALSEPENAKSITL